MNKRKAAVLTVLGLLGLATGGWWGLVYSVRPTSKGASEYLRFDRRTTLRQALITLEEKRMVRSAQLGLLYARLRGLQQTVPEGTFRLSPGETIETYVALLQKPIVQMVRIPEGWWIKRSAAILEKNNVCKASEYIALANRPDEFKDAVGFVLPKGSLEGYLYPDTYDLPPLLGARQTIVRQLKAFESKVASKMKPGTDLQRAVIIGSMVELEVALDHERPIVAGVIENRIKKGMRLELDATVLYALQEWKNLGPGVVRTVKSPYNTYLNNGLPPGPIGSPGAKSILAALNPAKHEFLFYVAKPDLNHMFAKTYGEHINNIRKRQKLLREAAR